MKATITDIDQRFSMETGRVTNFVIIRLPSGRELRAQVDDATMEELITESSKGPYEATPRDARVDAGSSSEVFVHEHFDNGFGYDGAVTQVARQQADEAFGDGPPPTPVDEVEQLEHHVDSGVVEWAKLPDTQLPPQMKKILRDSKVNPVISVEDLDHLKAQILERLSKQPKPGQVKWNQGAQRETQSRPIRTVPRDEAGNPRPPGGITEIDPGESQDDDDGVAQA